MRRHPVRWAHVLVVLLVVASLGCAARHIREAQSAFNEAARAENEQRAHALSGGSPLLDSSSAAAGYRLSLDLLEVELAQHEEKLREEKLLGTALVLKALCLWRLADLEDDEQASSDLSTTLQRIEQEQTSGTLALGTRDRVLVSALDGLRDHDRGLRASNLDEAADNFSSAVTVLDQALANGRLPPNHPVRVYLQLSQLASLRAWQAAVYEFEPDRRARKPLVQEIHTKAKQVVKSLEEATKFDPELRALVEQYEAAIGI